MQLTEEWLKETLAKNPYLKVQVQGGKGEKAKQSKENEERKQKYGNHKIYEYEDGFVSDEKIISGHGAVAAIYDSTKEYQPSHAFRLLGGRAMIAIRVCPICKKAFEGRVGVPKVYCDECTMLSDYAAMDTARSQAAWFFEDFGDEDEREDEKHESEQETDTAPLITITDESKLPKATRQSRESLLELISSRKRS